MRRLILILCLAAAACSLPTHETVPAAVLPIPAIATPTRLPVTAIPTGTQAPQPTASSMPVPTVAIDTAALRTLVDAELARYPGDWHILVEQVGGNVLYSRQVTQSIDVASVIKIPIALLFFKSLEAQNPASLKNYLAHQGIDGRTYQQLLQAMLVDSEEDATFSLLKAVEDSRLDVRKTLDGWGAAHTDVILRKSTVEDIATLLEGLYSRSLLTPDARDIVLADMAAYTSADDTRIGVVRKLLPCGGAFYNKRGTITAEYLAVADVALVEFPSPAGERAYLIAFFAYPGGEHDITYESLVQGMETLTPVFWQAIRVQSALPPPDGCSHP